MHFIGRFDESRRRALKDIRILTDGKLRELNNPKGSMLGHFDVSQIPPQIEEILDGEPYVAEAGDVLWTGVGYVHSI